MKIIYTKAITKDVRKIKNADLIKKIEELILELKNSTSLKEIKSVKKISNHKSAYRIRLKNYRLGFYLENDTVILARFLKRNDIYKQFLG